MIPKNCKRLAEVDFPIAAVSKHSAREKSIRHGHPSTLHLWWARRPLAACRAMLMALLLPDPCDPLCPEEFITKAKSILIKMNGRPRRWGTEVLSHEGLRKVFLEFIGDLSNWDNAANMDYLSVARELVKVAHPEETPLVVDPFAGGGSIPLEALRLGCEAFASDLNPVACLILKVMLEDIPRHGPELVEELRRVGEEIKNQAEIELAELYPNDPDGATPIAYLWARTVKCESPNCGAEIPLMRSFWLCKKPSRKRALRFNISYPKVGPPFVKFEIFAPKKDKEVTEGTVNRAKATCLCCKMVLTPERVRAQLSEQHGGADVIFNAKGKRIGGAKMLTVVTIQPGIQGRNYRLPIDRDYRAVWSANIWLKEILDIWDKDDKKGHCPIPDEPTPAGGGSGAGRAFSVQKYGMMKFRDLFTARQTIGLYTLSKHVDSIEVTSPLQIACKNAMALVTSRCADYNSSYARWAQSGEFVGNTFGRQALGPSWDFCETFLLSSESGGYPGALEWVAKVINSHARVISNTGQVDDCDACISPIPDESCEVWFTDPPYYDAVPYSDLSDYFFIWQKRTVHLFSRLDPELGEHPGLTPKIHELVQDETKKWHNKPKDKIFFEKRMSLAFSEGRRILRSIGIGCVVFAHKTTEGWEALLNGIIQSSWKISASWPIASERPGRLRSQDSAALATSVHLVCRPRPEDAPVGDWEDVLRELPGRVGDWMDRLQKEGIRGADLVFACIGPALEIFSRYSKVEMADGREVKLAEYLEKVWEVVGRSALEQVLGTDEAKARNGMVGVLEEDARLTALFLWTLQSTNGESKSAKEKVKNEEKEEETDSDDDEAPRSKTKGYSLIFDVVRRFAQPLGIDLPKWEDRIIETEKGVVRLLAVSERAKQIFGSAGIESAIEELLSTSNSGQMILPGFEELAVKKKAKQSRGKKIRIEDPGEMEASATTLDRVHAAMLLQSSGQANALRSLIKAELDRSSDFLRLANALSALYPVKSEEKRLLDAMLLAVPR